MSEFTVLNLNANSSSAYAISCGGEPLTVELAPGEIYTQTRPAGRLSSAEYTLTIQLEDEERTILSLPFEVE